MKRYQRLFLSMIIWGILFYLVDFLKLYLKDVPGTVTNWGTMGISVAFVATLFFVVFE